MTKEFYEIFTNVAAVIMGLIILVSVIAFSRITNKDNRELEDSLRKQKASLKRKKSSRAFKASQGFF